jgi:glycosyltransferase involved in cell wall biosynthesis
MKVTNEEHQELLHTLGEREYELSDLRQRVHFLQNRVENLEDHIDTMYKSTTWRVMRPVRILMLLLKNYKLFLRPKNYAYGLRTIKERGIGGLVDYIRSRGLDPEAGVRGRSYEKWFEMYDLMDSDKRKAIASHVATFEKPPLLSVVMPVYNVEERFLREAIDSVRAQIYTNWELCIADDCSPSAHIRTVLDEYAAKDARIKVTYREQNGHISECSNSALELATGEFVVLLDHDDIIPEHALYMVAYEVITKPHVDMLYSDEDKINEEGERYNPYFKSDWNPDLFFTQNMFNHLGAFRRSLVEKVGGFRKGFEGAQDRDLVLRCLLETKPENIAHIPFVLYHWRAIEGSTAVNLDNKDYATEAANKALAEYFAATGVDVEIKASFHPGYQRIIWPVPAAQPKVEIIIPTRNAKELTQQAIESILEKTDYDNYVITIVDNGSDEAEALAYFASFADHAKVNVLRYDHPFNYSAINNWAVAQTTGEIVALVNNDIEVISSEWLREMVSHALRKDVGAVGAKLLYPDNTLQHGGVLMGAGASNEPVAGHIGHKWDRYEKGYFCRACLVQELSAVTAACLVVRRDVFEEVGGLNEEDLKVAFNDVDFCMKIRAAGYRNIWTPHAELYHHESATRGYEDTPEKKARFYKEVMYMRETWRDSIDYDPFYNANLDRVHGSYGLVFPPEVVKPWETAA